MKISFSFSLYKILFACTSLLVLSSCTTVTLDEHMQQQASINAGDSIVVLGRRHSSDFETEPSFVNCLGKALEKSGLDINVVPEKTFLDALYPWVEPRTAPRKTEHLSRLLEHPGVREYLQETNLRYMLWLRGNTRETHATGSLGCTIGPGGGGCFGFGMWDDESNYELAIWDIKNQEEIGKVSADAKGTSYMPAVVVPIPLLARVQNNVCEALSKQLIGFFSSNP